MAMKSLAYARYGVPDSLISMLIASFVIERFRTSCSVSKKREKKKKWTFDLSWEHNFEIQNKFNRLDEFLANVILINK